MYLYLLDNLLRRVALVDVWESLIWTERFNEEGDFEVTVLADPTMRAIFKAGAWFSMSKSYRIMQVRKVEETLDTDLRQTLRVTGRSIEGMLRDRAAVAALYTSDPPEGWNLTKNPAGLIRQMFHDVCVSGVVKPADIIPNVTEGVPPWPSNIPYPTDILDAVVSRTTLYDAITELAKSWDLGFRLLRLNDNQYLSWDVYSGSDRTGGQTVLPPVIFSPQLDNLSNITSLYTIEDTKNVAYVFGKTKAIEVYPTGVSSVTGLDRNVLMVDATDIDPATVTNIDTALAQRGQQALAEHRTYTGFDGQVSDEIFGFVYQKDYFLGDLVEYRQGNGNSNTMRVTEQIFVSDHEGERMYPTLEIRDYVNLGSWAAWDINQSWINLDPSNTAWYDQI